MEIIRFLYLWNVKTTEDFRYFKFIREYLRNNHENDEIIEIIRSLNPQIEKRYKGSVKCIFGSYVHGEENPDSDLDVLVEFKEDANLLDLVGISLFPRR